MPVHKSVKLYTGAEMPTVGLGTWRSRPGQVEKAVEYAIKEVGYRHIDTAAGYANEAEVGVGIKAAGVPREDLFITTKLNNTDHGRVEQALLDSLEKLDTSYIDLWLMHWPAPMKQGGGADKSIDWLDTWRAMERVYAENPDKVKAIGVSNFSADFLDRLLKHSIVTPAVNQVELHPSCPQNDIRALGKKHGIVSTAYSPLGSENSPLLDNAVVKQLAEKYQVHPANILISLWANVEEVTVIPKSVTPERIESNFVTVELDLEEVESLLKISEIEPFRACNPEWTGWGDLGFEDRKGKS